MSNKEVSLLIINFLKNAVLKKEISEENTESIDVAIDCLADAFEVDKESHESVLSTFKGKSLIEILAEYKSGESAPKATKTTEAESVKKPVEEISEETIAKADELKREGNKEMAARNFEAAVVKYTQALELVPGSSVYLSNRAAAFSSLRKHEEAVKDALASIESNPKYSKAYSRLGLAYFALNRPKDSLDAYRRGLEAEGDNPSKSMKDAYAVAKKRVEDQLGLTETEPKKEEEPSSTSTRSAGSGASSGGMPDFSNLASMLGGAGGAGGLGNMLNNPQIMDYANRLMQNPDAMNNLMSNPAVQQLAQQFGMGGGAGGAAPGGSGMPDLSSVLNNPALSDLANQFLNRNNDNSN